MDTLLAWLILKHTPGIGNILFKRLIEYFKTPENVFQSSVQELCKIEGITQRTAIEILNRSSSDWAKKELDLANKKGYKILTLLDEAYPFLLKQIPDPPPVLYIYGIPMFSIKSIAIVGSREPTRYGIITAKRLSHELASLDITVISGMARGIDTAAHVGALSAKGKTVAVLGSGLERIYPFENKKLFHKIAENGAVVSEFPLMTSPEPFRFPVRNRIISGMSLGTVVVEAAQKSGSLITARLAGEQGREVFAVPGNIESFKSIGTHRLLKEGAKLVTNAQDILEELTGTIQIDSKKATKTIEQLPEMTSEEHLIFNALGPYPIHIDDLIRKLAMEPGKISSILLQLELKGIVQQTPGKFFSIESNRFKK